MITKGLMLGGVLGLMLASSAAMAAGNIQAGQSKAAMCMACHGVNGMSSVPLYPNLAGQKDQYLMKALHEYKDGKRSNAIMKAMAAPLSDQDIENLAAYYSSLKP